MERETWYIMEDDTPGDPALIAPDKKGVLRHEDGRAVAMSEYGPRSIGVDNPKAERAKAKKEAKTSEPEEPKRGYKTRDLKA